MKFASLLTTILCAGIAGNACTTFFLSRNGEMVFGRNYDWITETGMVHTNLRGLQKTALDLEGGKELNWTSKYGSISFNQYGKEFPTGGMNEKGLVVELMWLSESKFPAADERPALSVLQWIQYQLDNCSTIEEVIATDKLIRIAANNAPQHYLIADAQGRVATIEFLNGKLKVHQGASLPYPVLANSTYEESIRSIKNAKARKDSLAFTDNSLVRFQTACRMVETYKAENTQQPIVDYAFSILDGVGQQDFTKWSIVYDLKNLKIHFRTASHRDIRIIEMKNFDLSCAAEPRSFPMDTKTKGIVTERFIAYSDETNRKKLKKAFAESRPRISIPEEAQEAMARTASSVSCK